KIRPDEHGDWLNQRDDSFGEFINIGSKKDKISKSLFLNYSSGIKSNRDAWVYNFSKELLTTNIKHTIDFYNSEVGRYIESNLESADDVINFVQLDSTKFNWDIGNRTDLKKHIKYAFNDHNIRKAIYRPFVSSNLYLSRELNNSVYQMPKFFPEGEQNIVISIKNRWSGFGQIAFISNNIFDNQSDGGIQCFPLYLYEE